jgi:hypothetical protein
MYVYEQEHVQFDCSNIITGELQPRWVERVERPHRESRRASWIVTGLNPSISIERQEAVKKREDDFGDLDHPSLCHLCHAYGVIGQSTKYKVDGRLGSTGGKYRYIVSLLTSF